MWMKNSTDSAARAARIERASAKRLNGPTGTGAVTVGPGSPAIVVRRRGVTVATVASYIRPVK
jgi:hypothetical protein